MRRRIHLLLGVVGVSLMGSCGKHESPKLAFSFSLNPYSINDVRLVATEFAAERGYRLHSTADKVPPFEGEPFTILDFRRSDGIDIAVAKLPRQDCIGVAFFFEHSAAIAENIRDAFVVFIQKRLPKTTMHIASGDCGMEQRIQRKKQGT